MVRGSRFGGDMKSFGSRSGNGLESFERDGDEEMFVIRGGHGEGQEKGGKSEGYELEEKSEGERTPSMMGRWREMDIESGAEDLGFHHGIGSGSGRI
jgi:hypothetical protein